MAKFNGLPSLSNGYIVDGLETNDPPTNLNSGLSTNLVLGLNSIAEVTVNTVSYAVDQGRYGASQVNLCHEIGYKQVSREPVRTVERLEVQRGGFLYECTIVTRQRCSCDAYVISAKWIESLIKKRLDAD